MFARTYFAPLYFAPTYWPGPAPPSSGIPLVLNFELAAVPLDTDDLPEWFNLELAAVLLDPPPAVPASAAPRNGR